VPLPEWVKLPPLNLFIESRLENMRARVLWQSCVVAAVGCLASGVSLAQSAVDCSGVAEDLARLKCYDDQAARQKRAASPVKAPAPAPAAAARPAAPAPARPASGSSDFGLEGEALRRKQAAANPEAPKEPEQVVSRVQDVTTRPRGEYRITLEDGQVWEETGHSSTVLPPHVGDTVTIKRGMLGSYFLSHSSGGLALRVKRIN
jgi:hypothetical protein